MTHWLAVLRPEPGNAATAARIEAVGATALRLPLFAVAPVTWGMPDPATFDALLLTSANVLRFGGPLDRLKGLPVLAVGPYTATAARAAGFDVVATGASDAAALVAAATAHGVARALHLGGRDRIIEPGGPVAATIAVYTSQPLPVSADQIAALCGSTALLHSVRAARRLAELIHLHRTPSEEIGIAAFSPAVAAAAGIGWRSVAVAAAPNDAALLAAALPDRAR